MLGQSNVCDFFIDIYKVESDEDNVITPKQAVTEQIMAMLNNNILNKYGNESFEGWCEEGAVFENTYENRNKEFYNDCEKLMREITPLVDKLTYDYLAEL